jgi:DNA-binding transcriptional MerR regulator
MNIGEVVRLIGLSEHTLRYYEKVGLLPPIRRDASGNRLFTPEDIRWMEFLVKLRQTRMPLRQMLHHTGLVRQSDATLAERRAMLEAHERQVRATIVQMNECLGVLQNKLDMYRQWEREAAAD